MVILAVMSGPIKMTLYKDPLYAKFTPQCTRYSKSVNSTSVLFFFPNFAPFYKCSYQENY